jgi:hypothetical protein
MNPFYPAVAERADYRCEYCHAPEEAFNFPFEVEHIVPTSRGGSDDLNNLALSCRACNAYKAAFEVGRDSETQMQTPLFHPRRDVWAEHFQVNPESTEIVGVTATGRATLLRLQTNHPRQRAARLRWMQFGLFP